MKIEAFEISSKKDTVYQELLDQYKTNAELHELLNEDIIPSESIWAGDFRLITMLSKAIDIDSIKVYLIKDVDNNTFVWVLGKFLDTGKISMFPLLAEQSENLQLEVRRVLIEKEFIKEPLTNSDS